MSCNFLIAKYTTLGSFCVCFDVYRVATVLIHLDQSSSHGGKTIQLISCFAVFSPIKQLNNRIIQEFYYLEVLFG